MKLQRRELPTYQTVLPLSKIKVNYRPYTIKEERILDIAGSSEDSNTSFDNKGVAYGDTVKIPVAPMSALEDFTASNITSTGANSVASSVDETISAMKKSIMASYR